MSTPRVHLDTDLGSDTDDLCALAMLLGWPGTEISGVTTNTDPGGLRAGMTAYALRLAGRQDVPVRAGAEGTLAEPMVPFAFPDYWPEDDFDLQQDHLAARIVLERCAPLVVPLAVTVQVTLRASHLPRLRAAGPLGALLADQGEAHARDNATTELGQSWPGLPDDLLSFHHDPLACAAAAPLTRP